MSTYGFESTEWILREDCDRLVVVRVVSFSFSPRCLKKYFIGILRWCVRIRPVLLIRIRMDLFHFGLPDGSVSWNGSGYGSCQQNHQQFSKKSTKTTRTLYISLNKLHLCLAHINNKLISSRRNNFLENYILIEKV